MSGRFALWKTPRPSFEALSAWLTVDASMAMDADAPPQVVFIDYISLLTRDKFAGQEVQRIQRLVEELQVWTNEHEVVTIALHQVGRMDEGSAKRYHGDKPMTLESLKFGGEEIADVVLGTYRPANDPIGNMDAAEAAAQGIDDDVYQDAHARVQTHKDVTFLQLLKNRPGVHTNPKGIRLMSPNEAVFMRQAASDTDGENVRRLHG
jgi:replicative DNA helicase